MIETLELTITADDWDEGGAVWLSVVSQIGLIHRVPLHVSRELVNATQRYSASIGRAANGELAEEISAALSGLVFSRPEVRSIFSRARGSAASTRRSLLVRLLAAPHHVAQFPWELIADPDGGPHEFLALAPDVVFARSPRVRTRPVRTDPLPLPLRILVIASNPPLAQGDLQFDAYEDRRAILDELNHLRESGHVKVTLADPPTIEGIRSAVAEEHHGFHVVHFTGHASSDQLMLEQHGGSPQRVSAAIFAGLLQECPDLRLLVLAGCETAMHGDTTEERPDSALQMLSIAESCARDVCDGVIGMQAKLPFVAERIFVSCLYRALAGGRSIGQAVRLARMAVRDDRHAGFPRLDFSVPTLMVAGAADGVLVDSQSPSTQTPIRRARTHKEKLFERDPSLVARPVHLRTLVDFLNGRTEHRLLHVVGPQRVGKTDLIARAMREVEETTDFVLYCRLGDLGTKRSRVGKSPLARWIRELLEVSDAESWANIVEHVINNRFVIVVDNAEELDLSEQASTIGREINEVLGRHGDHRVVLIRTIGSEVTISDRYASDTLVVPELPPDDVRHWVIRHLPSLRLDDPDRFEELSRRLGSDLTLWRNLARRVESDPGVDLSAAADHLAETREASSSGDVTTRVQPVRVAMAGEGGDHVGRQEAFANVVLRIASRYGLAARLDTEGAHTAAPFGELLDIPSPFTGGTAMASDVFGWFESAVKANATLILADFGTTQKSDIYEHVLQRLQDHGTLVIAAGGNNSQPVWPAWAPTALAVGALDVDGSTIDWRDGGQKGAVKRDRRRRRTPQVDVAHGKPDIYAPGYPTGGDGYLTDTDFESIAPKERGYGASYSAAQVLLAAIVVLAAGGPSTDVRQILLASATEIPGVPGARILDLDAAMLMVQTQVIAKTLETGPGDLVELAARTGIAGSRIEPLVASMIAAGTAERNGDTVRSLSTPSST